MKRRALTALQLCTALMLLLLLAPHFVQAQSAADLEARLDQLGSRLTRLRDVSDIEKLQRSYGYYVDKQQWHDVRDLFTRDGMLELGGRGRFLGQERIFEFLRTGLGAVGPVPGVLQDHLQLQGVVTLGNDGLSARGRWSSLVVSGIEWGDAIYENEYVKEDGVWKLRSVHAVFNMLAPSDSGWISNTLPHTRPESALPPPDLPPSTVYLTFPNYQLAPYHYPNPVTGRVAPPSDPAAGGAAFGKR